jgi:RNA polymerase sigma-70 factor, ECF subfamily
VTQAAQHRPDYEAMSDDEIVTCLQHGEGGAFNVVIQRHNQRLFRVTRAVLGDDAEAEDVVQEAYVKAFSRIEGFRRQASLTTWLTRIALNEALDRRRRRRATTALDELETANGTQGGSVVLPHPALLSNDPERDAARSEIRRLVEAAVDRLPDDFRIVFVMREVEEMSIEETAKHLSIPQATVKTRLHRARRLVRAELAGTLASALAGSFPFAGSRCVLMTERVLARLGYSDSPDRTR